MQEACAYLSEFVQKTVSFDAGELKRMHYCAEPNDIFKKFVNCAVFSKKHLIFLKSKVE